VLLGGDEVRENMSENTLLPLGFAPSSCFLVLLPPIFFRKLPRFVIFWGGASAIGGE